ncbi:ferritin-like domain-containing protein [Paenarthrobacter ilicis]|uniref:DUF4439 domain-containing protein n=1 Tax=Paenarthrobacter ilicis TaxID=43665 RepID=UPI00300BB305
MNEDRSEKRGFPPAGRLVLVMIVALLVAGTGMILIPRDSGNPAPVPFSEMAREAALHDALSLRETAAGLAGAAPKAPEGATVDDAVTLLTTHARALLDPVGSPGSSPSLPASSASPPATESPTTRSTFASSLVASARQRLADAREADGGMARLLAAIGTSQLIESERLAAALKVTLPDPPASGKGTPGAAAWTCPSGSASPSPISDAGSDARADSRSGDASLAAVVRSQQEAVYAYQVAMKRLDGPQSAQAAKNLQSHQSLLRQAEDLARAACADSPASEPGYRLPQDFTANPAGSLAAVEAAALPVFGDAVAFSSGTSRQWAMDGLLAAARRTVQWGGTLPAFPGMNLDAGSLPPLPAAGTATPQATTAG